MSDSLWVIVGYAVGYIMCALLHVRGFRRRRPDEFELRLIEQADELTARIKRLKPGAMR